MQACSRLPAPSSASPSLPESSTAAAHTSKLIKAKGLINRRIEHFSRYGDFCGFSANLMPEPQATSSPPAPSSPTPALLPPPSTRPGRPLWAGRGTQEEAETLQARVSGGTFQLEGEGTASSSWGFPVGSHHSLGDHLALAQFVGFRDS